VDLVPVKLLALVLPLSFDTFAVSAALGVGGLDRRQRLRLSLMLALFEGGMPVVGVLLGATLAQAVGSWTDLAAAGLLIALGLWMAFHDDGDEARLAPTGTLGLLTVGVSVSLDELVIGFAIGLLRLPFAWIVVLIAGQAFVASQLGLSLGNAAGGWLREWAERAAGLALLAVGLALLVLHFLEV
jgi:putative Mn2+ efflux pump MntP